MNTPIGGHSWRGHFSTKKLGTLLLAHGGSKCVKNGVTHEGAKLFGDGLLGM
jgi:hypothetical protein